METTKLIDQLLCDETGHGGVATNEQAGYAHTAVPAQDREAEFGSKPPPKERTAKSQTQSSVNAVCEICKKELKYASSLKSHRLTHTGEHPFPCHLCEKRFTQASSLKTHLALHSDERKYKCNVCDMAFKQMVTYKTHMMRHTGNYKVECEVCHKKFRGQSSLKAHMWHHGENKKYSCKMCEKGFVTNTYLKMHEEKHTNEALSCEFCSRRFYTRERLEKHKKTHDPDMPYRCSVCNKKFKDKSDMKQHRITHREKKFPCAICNLKFISKAAVTAHIMIHTGERPYSCEMCKRRFRFNRSLKLHVMDHSGPESWPHECETCHQKFKTNERLKYHMYTHTGGSAFTCKTCGMGYADLRRLEDHMLIHDKNELTCKVCSRQFQDKELFVSHGLEHPPVDLNESQYWAMLNTQDQQFTEAAFINSKGYMCHVCDIIFPSIQLLKYHLPDHAADKPFMCLLCKKQLSSRKTLRAHMTVHSGSRYKCCICQKTFLTNLDLIKHMKSHYPARSQLKFKCTECGKCMKSRHGLVKHREHCISSMAKKQAERKQFRCGWCHSTFGDEEKLKIHMSSCNKNMLLVGKQSFHCVNCNQVILGDPSSLLQHQQFHKKTGSVTCNVCHGEFWPALPSQPQQDSAADKAPRANFVFKFLSDGTIQQHAVLHNKTILGDQYILVHSEQKDGKQVSYPPTVKSSVLQLNVQDDGQKAVNKEQDIAAQTKSATKIDHCAKTEQNTTSTKKSEQIKNQEEKRDGRDVPEQLDEQNVKEINGNEKVNTKVDKAGESEHTVTIKSQPINDKFIANNEIKSNDCMQKDSIANGARVGTVKAVTAIPVEKEETSAVSVLMSLINKSRSAMENKGQKKF